MDAEKDLTRDELNVHLVVKLTEGKEEGDWFSLGSIFNDIAVVNRDNLRNRHDY